MRKTCAKQMHILLVGGAHVYNLCAGWDLPNCIYTYNYQVWTQVEHQIALLLSTRQNGNITLVGRRFYTVSTGLITTITIQILNY
jgi:hypothetical protein